MPPWGVIMNCERRFDVLTSSYANGAAIKNSGKNFQKITEKNKD